MSQTPTLVGRMTAKTTLILSASWARAPAAPCASSARTASWNNKHVEGRGDRREDADAEIVGERELPRLAKAVEPADDQAIGERNELEQDGGADQRRAIAQIFAAQAPPRAC